VPSSTFSIRPMVELDSVGIDIAVDDVLFNLVTKDTQLMRGSAPWRGGREKDSNWRKTAHERQHSFSNCSLSPPRRQGCQSDGRTGTSVRLSVTSDKARVRHIRVNGMLTSDRVKPELLCLRWLPHRCHIGSLAITL
jgi:hypothetical protein